MPTKSSPGAESQTILEALGRYSREELVEMLASVLKTYVIDGVTPHAAEFGAVSLPTHLRELSFPQLISHLKMHLALPELERFSVSGAEVMVRIGERSYSLSDPNTVLPPRELGTGDTAPAAPRAPAPADDPPDIPEGEVDERFRLLEFD